MTLQQLTILLPVLGTLLPGIVKQLHGNNLVNGLLAGAVVVASAFGYVLLGGKITGNPSLDVPVIIAAIASLLAGPLKPLDQYLTENWFNVVKPKPTLSGPRVVGNATSSAYSPIPPRASLGKTNPPDYGG